MPVLAFPTVIGNGVQTGKDWRAEYFDYLEGIIPSNITEVHIVYDNLSVHKGKQVRQWLANTPASLFTSHLSIAHG